MFKWLRNAGWWVFLIAIVGFIVIPRMFKSVVTNPLASLWGMNFEHEQVEPDTVYYPRPPKIIDNWVERIVYRETEPDTVRVVIYEERPATVDFVGATVLPKGRVRVEVMERVTNTAFVLEGRLAGAGQTHVVVKPDSTIAFVTPNMGVEFGLIGGANLFGPQAMLEWLYFNDVPILNTTVFFPNIGVTYRTFDVEREDRELMPSIDASILISPWQTPGRINFGGAYSFGQQKVKPYVGITINLWRFLF